MLTKIALAAALAIGTAGAALASNENDGDTGGFRQLGPGGVVTDGVNPVFHPSMRAGASNAYGYAPNFTPKHTTK
jgi:ABC-type sugar transport system substrate-binding protein